MNREYHEWFSPYLGRKMELLVFGYGGARMLVFPTLRGHFYQYENHGMVQVLRNRIQGGLLQLFCVDSMDLEILYNRSLSPRDRILLYMEFEKYILHEVLPFSEGMNPNPSLTAHGCSLGASHALNIAFRHPHLFTRLLALSGRYDLTQDFGGGFRDLFDHYYDDDVYFNTPSHFVPNLTDPVLLQQLRNLDITLAIGERDPFIENNRTLSQTLWDKGVWHAFHVWWGIAHGFEHWREMVRLYA
jgi:esterase/lipase superfamily enzyme